VTSDDGGDIRGGDEDGDSMLCGKPWPSLRALTYLNKYHRKSLRQLDLSGTPVESTAIEKIRDMNKLVSLNLAGCYRLTDHVLTVIPNWKLLHLNLAYITRLTDAGLQELVTCHELCTLCVVGCTRLTGDGIVRVLTEPNLPRLSTLNAAECPLVTVENCFAHVIQSKPDKMHLMIVQEQGMLLEHGKKNKSLYESTDLFSLLPSGSSHKKKRTKRGKADKNRRDREGILASSPKASRNPLDDLHRWNVQLPFHGFRPRLDALALESQSLYHKDAGLNILSAVCVQRWWRKYIRKILLVREARFRRVKRKLASTNIQRVWRGGVARTATRKELLSKRVVVRRLELMFLRRRVLAQKKKGFEFFQESRARSFVPSVDRVLSSEQACPRRAVRARPRFASHKSSFRQASSEVLSQVAHVCVEEETRELTARQGNEIRGSEK
jgi:hypothetical protein